MRTRRARHDVERGREISLAARNTRTLLDDARHLRVRGLGGKVTQDTPARTSPLEDRLPGRERYTLPLEDAPYESGTVPPGLQVLSVIIRMPHAKLRRWQWQSAIRSISTLPVPRQPWSPPPIRRRGVEDPASLLPGQGYDRLEIGSVSGPSLHDD